jgi:hypothetical protein
MRAILTAIGISVCLASARVTTVTPPDPNASNANTIRLLWRDPGTITTRDLYWGAGSEARAPKPPFTFVSENLSGTKPKINVSDASGVPWSVKLATVRPGQNEVHAEIAASRLVWALGYFVDENYFVPEGRIEGVKDLKRAAEVVGADGSFRIARFERRAPDAQPAGNWDIEENRFQGTRELSGLQALMMFLGNWDYTPGNTIALRVTLPNGDVEERYFVSDLGATFGRMRGGVNQAPNRWSVEDFSDAKYLTGVSLGKLEFRGPLLRANPLAIPIAHARWFSAMLSQLTDAQIHQAFEASGASPTEVAAFAAQVRKRINELEKAMAK